MSYKKIIGSITTAAMIVGMAPLAALAVHNPEHYTLDGNANYITPGNASDRAVRLVSDATATDPYGAIDFGVEDGTTFADLTTLSTDFRPDADDTCVGGSPRFSISLDSNGDGVADGNVFAYFGTDSAGAPCIPGVWQNTGDMLEVGRLVDTSQLGGTFYDTYANALANYGSYEVVGIAAVVDASWAAADSEQGVDIDNTLINSTLFTYEVPPPPVVTTKNECKNGGWQDFTRADGTTFKNQGDCIQYVNTGK